jgi:hypothetical protein
MSAPYTYTYNYDEESKMLTLRYAKQSDIDAITWPVGLTDLYIVDDYIDHLKVPEGVEILHCSGLGLKSLEVPDSVYFLYGNNNFLKHVELPQNIEVVELSCNYLESISFRGIGPRCVGRLDLMNNERLCALDFEPPEALEVLKLDWRLRTHGELNPKLKKIADDTAKPVSMDW